jgi:hypothetical protein
VKISHDTPDLLVLDYTPWLWAVVLMIPTLIFIGLGLSLLVEGEVLGALGAILGSGLWIMGLVIFVERLQVILDRRTGTVTLRRRTVLRYRQDTYDLAGLDRADVQRSSGSKGGSTYRPVLVFVGGEDRGIHPITQIYSSGGGAHQAANAINGWLGRGGAD